MGEGLFVLPIEGQKLGMGLILLNYMYDWEGSGPAASRQALVWGKSNIGSTNDGWPVLGTPALFPTYQLGSHEQTTTDSDYSVEGTVTAPIEGKTSVTLSVTTPSESNLVGIKVEVAFNAEKLTLIQETNNSNYFIGQMIPHQTVFTDAANGRIALTAIALTGNKSDVFSGGTADFAKLKFSVADTAVLEDNDITITVTDAVNVNAETIFEKFGTSVTYKELDTRALEAAIEKAQKLNADEYTTDTFAAVMTELEKASNVLTNIYTTQHDLDAAAQALEQALACLIKTYKVDGTVSIPQSGKTSMLITVTTPLKAELAGIKVEVSFNTEKLALITEEFESDYFVGDLFPSQIELVDVTDSKISLMSLDIAGSEYNTFPGGTANFANLNFKIAQDAVLEDGDITITVTDAVNVNAETIFEKFGTSVTYLRLNTSALEAAIEKAKALDKDLYTTDSFQAVQQTLSVAEGVLQKENVTQTEIDNATAALETAINSLVKAIIGIEVIAPTKTNYLMGENFVADGFAVQNIYESGKKEATTGTYEEPEMSTVGNKVIEVTAGDFKGSFTIRVSTKGDINADGKISLVDVVSVARAAVESMQNSNSAEVVYGDVIGNDGKVTLIDVLKLARVSLGVDTID
mgnify:CR=1 FL=1